jgi:thiol-disulfide isomerase/thioredoxin
MSRLFIFIALMLALAPAVARAQEAGHEYSPLVEKTVNYKDWTFKSLKDGAPVNLRSLAQGKRLMLVVYFAPWCPNWRNESPVAARLYEKYKANGLEVVGVGEYGAAADMRAFFGDTGAPYMVVIESEAREDRDKTTHYGYRQLTGDARRWGSPWNIFLEPSKLAKTGDILTDTAWIVNGELIEMDVEKFIRERLGLDAKPKSQAHLQLQPQAVTPCKQEP